MLPSAYVSLSLKTPGRNEDLLDRGVTPNDIPRRSLLCLFSFECKAPLIRNDGQISSVRKESFRLKKAVLLWATV